MNVQNTSRWIITMFATSFKPKLFLPNMFVRPTNSRISQKPWATVSLPTSPSLTTHHLPAQRTTTTTSTTPPPRSIRSPPTTTSKEDGGMNTIPTRASPLPCPLSSPPAALLTPLPLPPHDQPLCYSGRPASPDYRPSQIYGVNWLRHQAEPSIIRATGSGTVPSVSTTTSATMESHKRRKASKDCVLLLSSSQLALVGAINLMWSIPVNGGGAALWIMQAAEAAAVGNQKEQIFAITPDL